MNRPEVPCRFEASPRAGERPKTTDPYLDRVRAAHARVREQGLTKAWIARRIRRSRPHVSAVLHGRDRGPGTLLLIEALLERVEAGEVTPR